MDNIFSVKGKVAIVTGGSRGVGLMIAKAFVKSGAKVYISSRDGEVCESTAKELSKDGTCESIPTDLSNQEVVISLVESFKLKEDKKAPKCVFFVKELNKVQDFDIGDLI